MGSKRSCSCCSRLETSLLRFTTAAMTAGSCRSACSRGAVSREDCGTAASSPGVPAELLAAHRSRGLPPASTSRSNRTSSSSCRTPFSLSFRPELSGRGDSAPFDLAAREKDDALCSPAPPLFVTGELVCRTDATALNAAPASSHSKICRASVQMAWSPARRSSWHADISSCISEADGHAGSEKRMSCAPASAPDMSSRADVSSRPVPLPVLPATTTSCHESGVVRLPSSSSEVTEWRSCLARLSPAHWAHNLKPVIAVVLNFCTTACRRWLTAAPRVAAPRSTDALAADVEAEAPEAAGLQPSGGPRMTCRKRLSPAMAEHSLLMRRMCSAATAPATPSVRALLCSRWACSLITMDIARSLHFCCTKGSSSAARTLTSLRPGPPATDWLRRRTPAPVARRARPAGSRPYAPCWGLSDERSCRTDCSTAFSSSSKRCRMTWTCQRKPFWSPCFSPLLLIPTIFSDHAVLLLRCRLPAPDAPSQGTAGHLLLGTSPGASGLDAAALARHSCSGTSTAWPTAAKLHAISSFAWVRKGLWKTSCQRFRVKPSTHSHTASQD
mmetsp:Transcript_37061/g.82417  ORF Transcript_37061/g.82417 Transcript_37061/m.82417 type:complete len:558 (-) Transcript_37061:327-2000(-)